MPDSSDSRSRVRVFRDADAVVQLAPIWEALWHATDPLPPMLELEWVRKWWQLHGDEGEPFIVVVYQNDEPVGLAPLYIRGRELTSRGVLKTVLLIGTGEAEIEEVYGENAAWLAAPEHRDRVTAAVAETLLREGGAWDSIKLQIMGPDTVPLEQLEQLLSPQLAESTLTRQVSHRIITSSFEDYAAGIDSRNRRWRLRRLMRKSDEAGLELVMADGLPQAYEMFDAMVRLHQGYWQERGEPGACSSPVFLDFHRHMIEYYWQQDRLWLFGLRWPNGGWLSIDYDIQVGDTLYCYVSGADYREGKKLSPGKLLVLHAIELAANRGIRVIDLMAGSSEYKQGLGNDSIETASFEGLADNAVTRAWRGVRALRRRLRPAREA